MKRPDNSLEGSTSPSKEYSQQELRSFGGIDKSRLLLGHFSFKASLSARPLVNLGLSILSLFESKRRRKARQCFPCSGVKGHLTWA
jgi:hypothetical protein